MILAEYKIKINISVNWKQNRKAASKALADEQPEPGTSEATSELELP